MRVLFATAEAFPLAKTGGLADVSASLPAALSQMGTDVRLIMPAYPQALARAGRVREAARLGSFGACGPVRLLETMLPGRNIPVWLIDCPSLYDRPGSLYQDENGVDWPDNDLRFALLNHAAAAIACDGPTGWRPDIVHANDWHCGLLPLLLAQRGAARPATLFTIHNLAYQGQFDVGRFAGLGLPPGSFNDLEFWGRICFLKAGIAAADAITTVSPNYAREILSPEFGCGLDGLLRARSESSDRDSKRRRLRSVGSFDRFLACLQLRSKCDGGKGCLQTGVPGRTRPRTDGRATTRIHEPARSPENAGRAFGSAAGPAESGHAVRPSPPMAKRNTVMASKRSPRATPDRSRFISAMTKVLPTG